MGVWRLVLPVLPYVGPERVATFLRLVFLVLSFDFCLFRNFLVVQVFELYLNKIPYGWCEAHLGYTDTVIML